MIQSVKMLLLSGVLFLVMACGTTVEKQEQRYKRNLDTVEALLAKHPMMRSAVAGKLSGFKTEHDKITGDEEAKKKALIALNRRIEEYVKKLDPSMAPKTTASKPGSKLNQTGVAPAATGKPLGAAPGLAAPSAARMGAAPVGGKLGGPAPTGGLGTPAVPGSPGMAPTPMAPTGKLGGPAPMAPAGKLGGTAPMAPPSGKLGGTR